MVEGTVPVGDPKGDDPSPGVAPRENRPYLRPLRPTPWSAYAWIAALAVVLAGAGVGYYLWRANAPDPAPGAPLAGPQSSAPGTAAPATPAIQHPLASAEPAEPLPSLGQSDGAMSEALARLFGGALGDLLQPDRVIARIVVTVDNLPRRSVPARMLPVKPVPGAFETEGGKAMSERNARRYAPYVALAQALDARAGVELYARFYPLFQKAYEELGDPRGYFNDRVVAAIDDLLETPEAKAPPALARPGVLYQFADPALESRSAGQKLLLRMGGENAAKVKAKLREVRAELAKRSARR